MCITIFSYISCVLFLSALFNLGYCASQHQQDSPENLRQNRNQPVIPDGFHHNHSPYHHHHHHHFHHYHHQQPNEFYPGGGNGWIFPGKINQISFENSSNIPLNVFQEMDDYADVDDLLSRFVEGFERKPASISNRFDTGEESDVIRAKCPKCEPQLQVIDIIFDDDPNIVHIPKCVKVERCSGCCSSNLFSCQPISTEKARYEVQKLDSFNKGKFKKVQKEIVTVEKHTKCRCQCRIKEKDCSKYQVYNKSGCRCICNNFEEERKCYENSSLKIWEPDTCTCQCRNIFQCSTGFIFDIITCRCVPYIG